MSRLSSKRERPMEIKNLMESLVFDALDQIAPDFEADGDALRDAACYVLNRLQPRYTGSTRGIARLTRELEQDHQVQVDILRLANEAMRQVTSVPRAPGGYRDGAEEMPGPAFNFPVIRGRLLNGTTFEPLAGLEVELFKDGESAAMFNSRWANPYTVSDHTPGTYLFCPRAEAAGEVGASRTAAFEIRATHADYDPFRHLFRVTVVAEKTAHRSFSLEDEFVLPDLYLFPR